MFNYESNKAKKIKVNKILILAGLLIPVIIYPKFTEDKKELTSTVIFDETIVHNPQALNELRKLAFQEHSHIKNIKKSHSLELEIKNHDYKSIQSPYLSPYVVAIINP